MPPASTDETELEMVWRHVLEGEVHLANQGALIARLKTSCLPTEEAEALLDTFEVSQRQHEAYLTHIESTRDKIPAVGRASYAAASCSSAGSSQVVERESAPQTVPPRPFAARNAPGPPLRGREPRRKLR